jgi:hypothetical protein
MLARHRVAATLLLVLVAFGALAPAAPAGAATDTGTEIYPGWKFMGATVTTPGKPPRHFSSRQTVAFVQSWYIATIMGPETSLTEERPPTALPVYTVKANDIIESQGFTFTSFYVTNGKKAWVGIPKQSIGPGAFVPKEKWWIAPPRAILAFEGKVGPDLSILRGETTTTTTTTTTPAATADHGSGSSAGWVVGGIVLAVVLVGAIGQFVRSRRRAPTG